MKQIVKGEIRVVFRLALCAVWLGSSFVHCHAHEGDHHQEQTYHHAHILNQMPANTHSLHDVRSDDHSESHECCCKSGNHHPLGDIPCNIFPLEKNRSLKYLTAVSIYGIFSDINISPIIQQPPPLHYTSNPTLSSLRTVVLLA